MFLLRRQLILMVSLSLIAFLYGVSLIKATSQEAFDLNQKLIESYEIEAQGQRWAQQRPNDDEIKAARAQMEALEPEQRRAAFRRVFQALDENSPLKSKVEFLQKSEQEYRRVEKGRSRFLAQHLAYLVLALTCVVTLSFLALIFYFRKLVFAPIHLLSRKMTDFLNDRYTYQFTVPANNELGHLQATFNALAQRVLRNMEDLTSLDHAKSEFLSIASHELRTPLTSIKGSLSLMKSGVVGETNEMTNNLLQIAELETDRLIRLINELLDLAKIEAGKFEVHPEWNPIANLVQKTFQSLSGLAGAAEIELHTDASQTPVLAWMDADRVQQVLTNLLSNAIKFSPKGAKVEVHTEINSKQQLLVAVRDHGRGIAPEDQELIFQKFRQATSVKNPLVKGTGLGLAIAKALVEQHGGEIGVHSKPGAGSTFYFTLPQWQYSTSQVQTQKTTGAAA